MTSDQIQTIVDRHLKWLRGEAGGERADLSRSDLRRADLSRADLSDATAEGWPGVGEAVAR